MRLRERGWLRVCASLHVHAFSLGKFCGLLDPHDMEVIFENAPRNTVIDLAVL